MHKILLALMTMLFVVGCATTGGGASAVADDTGGLPEIAAMDDMAIDPLPDLIPAEQLGFN